MNWLVRDHADACRAHVYSNERFEWPVHIDYPPRYAEQTLGPLVGDACHNLRAALDHAVCEIVTICKGDASRLYFPMNDTREALVGTRGFRLIEECSPFVAASIADKVKPFRHGGEAGFQALNHLDIADKHRTIIAPIFQRTGGIKILANELDVPPPMPGWRLAVAKSGGNGHAEYVPLTPGFLADLHNQQYGHAIAEVCFGKGLPFEDQPIVPTLHLFRELVTRALDVIASAFLEHVDALYTAMEAPPNGDQPG